MTEENRKLNIEAEVIRAREVLVAARNLFEDGLYADCISRCYYAMYHFTRAVLMIKSMEPKTHEGLSTLFGLHFVKSGMFSPEMGRMLSRMQKYREDADYRPLQIFTREATEKDIADAESFCREAEEFLVRNGYIGKKTPFSGNY